MTPAQQEHYDRCIAEGTSPMLAEMFALQQAPGCVTDATFMHGHANGNQFEKTPGLGDYYKKIAEKAGVNVKGKVYKSGLADFPGDPRAWVDGRGDVVRLCEERGDTCTGSVNVKGRAPGDIPRQPVAVAEDIIEREVQDIVESAPVPVPPKARRELKEKVRAKRKPHWAK